MDAGPYNTLIKFIQKQLAKFVSNRICWSRTSSLINTIDAGYRTIGCAKSKFRGIKRRLGCAGGSGALNYLERTPADAGEKPVLKINKLVFVEYRPNGKADQNNLKYCSKKHSCAHKITSDERLFVSVMLLYIAASYLSRLFSTFLL